MNRRPARVKPDAGPGTREKILDVAEALIDRHGLEGLRLVDVARAVGIQPPSIFGHFEGREAVADAVARRVTDQIFGLVARILDEPGADPERALRRGVRAFAGHLADHPAHVRLLLRDLARTRRGADLDLSSPRIAELEVRVGEVLAAGARAGVFREVSAADFMAVVEGALLAAVGWAGFDDEGRPREQPGRARLQALAEEVALGFAAARPAR